ncbi:MULTISPECIES: TPM domain-containing protein [unclassified Sphingomonas]|uniref:TPM domain-containing protein n=1 Tax=unclassified Sphingomonas TaxID=196159 RepID=UPI002151DA8D|nr:MULTISPECIES: TPM domain-containing protein [unclassified Sphingomonas]MCR5870483.1 TPM domain-containing protein [Sphingomonas sp. J344]UUY01171.1 TPM domain-containing protein [Sphingomonas sp. J315]
MPALTGRVVDAADLLSPDKEALLDRALQTTERATRGQFVVVTLPTLHGRKIEDVGVELGRKWGIGRVDVDDGVMLIVAPNERQVRIEVGYGLEGVLRDEEAKAIITRTIIPRIRSGNMSGAILAGSAAIIREINVPGATP